ncbi:hypothetical protein EJ110_NYTH12229 [Nymphaea thermarum]|nr:hypothetical protein EJ110_NYTH12229 [Nymphaea thermarum]
MSTCSNVLKLQIKVNKQSKKIVDAYFNTFGYESTITLLMFASRHLDTFGHESAIASSLLTMAALLSKSGDR